MGRPDADHVFPFWRGRTLHRDFQHVGNYRRGTAAAIKVSPDRPRRREHRQDHVAVALTPSPWLQPGSPHIHRRMIRITITPAAFETIAATLLLGCVGYENAVNEKASA